MGWGHGVDVGGSLSYVNTRTFMTQTNVSLFRLLKVKFSQFSSVCFGPSLPKILHFTYFLVGQGSICTRMDIAG